MKEDRFRELSDSFEENNLSDIWKDTKLVKGAIEFQSKIVRKGKQAIKITVRKGDRKEVGSSNSKPSERDELLEKKRYGPMEDKIYRYSFSMHIPKDFPIVSTRLVLAQWKQQDDEGKAKVTNPIIALRYVNGELFITLQTTDKRRKLFSTNEELRGKWLDFTFEIKLTRKKSGFVKVFMNKKQIVNYNGITSFSKEQGYPDKRGTYYFKMGLYRDKMEEPMTIYIDEFHKKVINTIESTLK